MRGVCSFVFISSTKKSLSKKLKTVCYMRKRFFRSFSSCSRVFLLLRIVSLVVVFGEWRVTLLHRETVRKRKFEILFNELSKLHTKKYRERERENELHRRMLEKLFWEGNPARLKGLEKNNFSSSSSIHLRKYYYYYFHFKLSRGGRRRIEVLFLDSLFYDRWLVNLIYFAALKKVCSGVNFHTKNVLQTEFHENLFIQTEKYHQFFILKSKNVI